MACRARLVHRLCCRRTSIGVSNRSISSLFDSGIFVGKNESLLGFRSLIGKVRSAMRRNQLAIAKFESAGSRLSGASVRNIIGFSVVYGIASSSSSVAFSMAGNDYDVDGSDMTATYTADSVIDRDEQALWTLVRKVWIPSLFFVSVVMMSWNHPIEFAIKFLLALFSTKPNPLSVYISVEQLCNQYTRQHPWSYDSQPLKAKNVDVIDCGLFCIGRVVIRDQRFILIGVLGAWWVWPSHLKHYFQFQTGFDEIKNRTRQRLTLQVPKSAGTRCP